MRFRTISLVFFLFGSVLLSSCSSSDQERNRERQQLLSDPGVVSYTFRNQFQEDFYGTLDFIRKIDIKNIEFSSLFGKTSAEVREALDERGLVCTSYGVGYDDLVNNPEQVVEDARILGAGHVRIAWIPHDSPFDIEDVKRAVTDFNHAGRILNENGLKFAYHNHGFEFQAYEDGTLFDYLVQNTNADHVNFEMDLFWVAHPGQDPVALLEKYPQRFSLMHLKDLKKGVDGDFSGRAPNEYDVPLGTGQIDYPAVLRAAKNTGIEHFYIEDESAEVHTRVPESLKYIRSLVD
ncbi:MAG: sugar phosphate isomerase/epimerase [Balneolales bacterium]